MQRNQDHAEARFRDLLESTPDPILVVDEHGTIVLVNARVGEVLGYGREELIGQPVEVLVPERFEVHRDHRSAYARSPTARPMGSGLELWARHADGREVPVEISLSPIATHEGLLVSAAIRDVSERRVAERAMRELAAIVDSTADAVIGLDLEMRITSWNRGAERVFGYAAEEAIGRSAEILAPPGEASELPGILAEIEAGDRVESFEAERMRKDGRRIVVAVTISPIRDDRGDVVGASKIARDITEQKAIERRLKEAARHFDMVQELVATCGFDGYFKHLNGAWEQLLGWKPEELLPNPFIGLAHPDDRAPVEAEVARLAGGESTAEFRLRIAERDGGYRWTEWSATPDLAAGLFYCVGRDITVRMETERARAAESRQLAEAQRMARVGSWEVNLDTGERVWSAQQFRNLGFLPDDPMPSTEQLRDRVHPEDRHAFESVLVGHDGAEPSDFSLDYRIVLPAGELRTLETNGRYVVDADGSRRLVGTSRDVTAERDAERVKDEFFNLVSHELRTPLTSIIGYAELLSEMEAESLSEQGRRFVEVIERNSRRELNLVGDLLMLTRVTAGTFEIERSRADLAEIARTTLQNAGPAAEDGGVTLSLRVDAPAIVDGDPHRLAQVVENLVSNAVKFTPPGGSVTVAVGGLDRRVFIEVADTGIGIPRNELGRLFDRMYRAEEAERRHIPGTGLGLTIVKAIVDAHDAAISIDSEPGRGTTVRVELPAHPEHAEGSPPGSRSREPSSAAGAAAAGDG